jgi:hypothetical protein
MGVGQNATKTIDQITKNNLTTHMIRLARTVNLKMRKIEHAYPQTNLRENNWNLYDKKQDGVSHTQLCWDIKRTNHVSVHRIQIVNNDTTEYITG